MAASRGVVATGAALLACIAVLRAHVQAGLGFVSVTSPAAATSQGTAAGSAWPATRAAPGPSRPSSCSSDLGVAGAIAVAAALAGVAARRHVRVPQVTRYGRRKHKFQYKVGSRPLFQRPIFKDVLKDYYDGALKYWNREGMRPKFEERLKQTLYGKQKIAFSSKMYDVEEIPWDNTLPQPGIKGNQNPRKKVPEHFTGDPFYVRKFLEPAKFKKLELASWELPANTQPVVTLRELVDAGVQYGHATNVWHQDMLKFLYADHDGSHIFDLVQTAAWLNRACYYCFEAAAKGATFLMVGTKEQASKIVYEAAKETGSHHATKRFVGGMLTNLVARLESIALMKNLEDQQRQGIWRMQSREEQANLEKRLKTMQRWYNGMRDMTDYPDIMIVVDEKKERFVVQEAKALGIPVVGLIDSNSSPAGIDLPIPGNASGTASIALIIGKLKDAILKGQIAYKSTPPGEREVPKRAWDPWLYAKNHNWRLIRRHNMRQHFLKLEYGSYEAFQDAMPYGEIYQVAPYKKFRWGFPNT